MRRGFRKAVTAGGLALFFLPLPNPILELVAGAVPGLHAQRFPDRLRQPPARPAVSQPTPAASPTAPPSAASPPATSPAAPLPPSLLDKPAQPAEIHFTTASLSIHAENSSLSQILRSIASESGMQLQGLGSDERVFGNFGPGKPRDVLSDLLNGTPYNILMVGDLSNGAPRQLILTPAGPATDSASSSPAGEESANTGDEPPGEVAPPNPNPQAIKTPQQLYQELQEMRQREQQGLPR